MQALPCQALQSIRLLPRMPPAHSQQCSKGRVREKKARPNIVDFSTSKHLSGTNALLVAFPSPASMAPIYVRSRATRFASTPSSVGISARSRASMNTVLGTTHEFSTSEHLSATASQRTYQQQERAHSQHRSSRRTADHNRLQTMWPDIVHGLLLKP